MGDGEGSKLLTKPTKPKFSMDSAYSTHLLHLPSTPGSHSRTIGIPALISNQKVLIMSMAEIISHGLKGKLEFCAP